jgi:hypothetical protein
VVVFLALLIFKDVHLRDGQICDAKMYILVACHSEKVAAEDCIYDQLIYPCVHLHR